MSRTRRVAFRSALTLAALSAGTDAPAEDLTDAWRIALSVNGRLQSQVAQSVASGLTVEAAKRDFLPKIQNTTINTILEPSPIISPALTASGLAGNGTAGVGGVGAGAGSGAAAGAGGLASPFTSSVYALGKNQHDLPIALTNINVPLYQGGRLRAGVDQARALLDAQKNNEIRTALDLKLTVAEAYIGVLRARRSLEVAESDRTRLASFANDTRNRRQQQLATRNDELSAEVQYANARQREITARRVLDSAKATYNRYLCRPLTAEVSLADFTEGPPDPTRSRRDPEAAIKSLQLPPADESEVVTLTGIAFGRRPELANLTAQARALSAQAKATLAGIKPQINMYNGHTFLGAESYLNQNFFTSTVVMNWTLTDAGATRRRADALKQQERAALRERADTAAQVALDVRNRWLEQDENRRRVPVAAEAYIQAEENVDVVIDRYRQGLATYTQVLDAEAQRVQSYNDFFSAIYDAVLAGFRLHRAVGDI